MEDGPRSHALAALLLLPVLVGAAVLHAPLLDGGFWGSDDWSHLQQAVLVADGRFLDAFQLRLDIYVGAGQAALRQVATLLWGLDFALFGVEPSAYYRTNLILHLALVTLTWALARQWNLGAVPAATAAALYAFQPEIAETIWFLAARSEQLAHVFAASTLLLWPRLRTSSWGAGAAGLLWTLALFSKTTAGWLPLALLGWEVLYGGRDAWRPAALVRRFWGIGLAAVLYLATIAGLLDVGNTLAYGPDGGAGSRPFSARGLGEAIAGGLLVPTWQPGTNPAPTAASWVRAALILGVSGAGLALARGDRARRVALAVVVILAGLVLPAPVLAQGMDAGRYLVPAALGLGLLCAASAEALPTWAGRGACVALVTAAVLAFQAPGGARFRVPDAPDLQALASGAATMAPADRQTLRVALPHPDPTTLRLLAREALFVALVPGVERVQVFLEGHGQLWKTSTSEDPTYLGDCHEFLPTREEIGLGPVLRQDGDRWVPQTLDASEPGLPIESWLLHRDDDRAGWALGPVALALGGARPVEAVEDGVRWRGTQRFGSDRLNSLDLRGLRGLRSVGLDLHPARVCGVRVSLRVSGPPAPPPRCAPLEPARFALLTWGRAVGPHLGPHAVLPLADTDEWQIVELDLSAAPSWAVEHTFEGVGFVPSNTGGEAVVGGIELLGCRDTSG